MKYIALVCAIIGLALFVTAGGLYLGNLYFTSHAETTTGSVTSIITATDPEDDSTSYCPVIQFTTKAGQTASYVSNVCSSLGVYNVGDKVELYYDPQNPENAQLKGVKQEYLSTFSFTCLGIPFLGAGLILYIASRRRKTIMIPT